MRLNKGADNMGMWIYMFIITLIMPLTMVFIGRAFINKAPKKINAVFGYRTSMSMKNKDTWQFAHNVCGRFWYKTGLGILPTTVIVMLLVLVRNVELAEEVGGITVILQLVPIFLSMFVTERELNKVFNKDGTRR